MISSFEIAFRQMVKANGFQVFKCKNPELQFSKENKCRKFLAF